MANCPRGCLANGSRGKVEDMSAQPIHSPKVMPVPAATPKAIRAVLVNAAEPGLLERFEDALEAAIAEARDTDSVEPLNAMLRHWRAEAAGWCNPVEHRAFLAKVEGYRVNGIPPEKRISSDEVWAAWQEHHGVTMPNPFRR